MKPFPVGGAIFDLNGVLVDTDLPPAVLAGLLEANRNLGAGQRGTP